MAQGLATFEVALGTVAGLARSSRSEKEPKAFIGKLRVFLIACQDATHEWLMNEFPDLFIIESKKTYQGIHPRFWRTLFIALATCVGPAMAQPGSGAAVGGSTNHKPRIIVTTDLGADPDDEQSLVRLLVSANEFDIEGLIVSTSCWKKNQNNTAMLDKILDAYGKVLPNLEVHAKDYPAYESLKSISVLGQTGYGMSDVGAGKDSKGSNLIIAAVDKDDPRPVWVQFWGGGNNLAQAIWKVRATPDLLKGRRATARHTVSHLQRRRVKHRGRVVLQGHSERPERYHSHPGIGMNARALTSGFVLDQSLSTTGLWSQVAFPYATNANVISVTTIAPTGNKFFRLRKP